MSAVINKQSFDKISGYLRKIKSSSHGPASILVGGGCDASEGYYIEPTVIVTTDPHSPTMIDELFGPVVTVYVYPHGKYEENVSFALGKIN